MAAVIRAIQNGETEEFTRLVNRGEDVNIADTNGSTALHFVCEKKKLEALALLIEKGVNINHANKKDQSTALHIASTVGFTEGVEKLIQGDANLELVDKNGFTPLLVACKGNHVNAASLLIAAGANVNHITYDGNMALGYVIRNGMDATMDLLLRAGASVNRTGQRGNTAAHLAARAGRCNAVKRLSLEGADFNIRNWRGSSPLQYAAMRGNVATASDLLEGGADIDSADHSGFTALINACHCRQQKMVDFLISKNANVNLQTKQGETALITAVRHEALEIVQLLLNNKANPRIANNFGTTPLHIAGKLANDKIWSLLVKQNANIFACDARNKIPSNPNMEVGQRRVFSPSLGHCQSLTSMAKSPQRCLSPSKDPSHTTELKRILRSASSSSLRSQNKVLASINLSAPRMSNMGSPTGNKRPDLLTRFDRDSDPTTPDASSSLFLSPVAGGTPENPRISLANNKIGKQLPPAVPKYIKEVKSRGGITICYEPGSIRETPGYTRPDALMYVKSGNLEKSRECLKNGADAEKRDSNGSTLLHIAAEAGDLEMVQLLIKYNANVNAQDTEDLDTPLHRAVYGRFAAVTDHLLKNGADPNAENGHKETPLHRAIRTTGEQCIKLLVTAKAVVDAQDRDGVAPLALAASKGNLCALKFLIYNGSDPNLEDTQGKTPFIYAYEAKRYEILPALAEAGAYVDHMDLRGRTPLHEAALIGDHKMVKILIDVGAPVFLKDDKGNTPLHVACEMGRFEIAELLIEAGAPLRQVNANGQTVENLAEKSNNAALVILIQAMMEPEEKAN